MDQDEVMVNQISERIIGCAFRVMNTLGIGFLEKVYENALAHELRTASLRVTQQQAISVSYNGINLGDYTTDLLVESTEVLGAAQVPKRRVYMRGFRCFIPTIIHSIS